MSCAKCFFGFPLAQFILLEKTWLSLDVMQMKGKVLCKLAMCKVIVLFLQMAHENVVSMHIETGT